MVNGFLYLYFNIIFLLSQFKIFLFLIRMVSELKRKILVFVIISLIFIQPVSASDLYLFNSSTETKQIIFNIPDEINQNWYPLRESSQYLPFSVQWIGETREIEINSEAIRQLRPFCAIRRYNSKSLGDDLKIINDITYCSPKFLNQLLDGIGFIYNNQIYCYNGDNKSDDFIYGGKSTRFVPYVKTGLYELSLKSPEDYAFVIKYINGISYINPSEAIYHDAVGYINSHSSKPICYIIGDSYTSATMASLIAHEAMHVYQVKTGGMNTEAIAKQYEKQILNKLLAN